MSKDSRHDCRRRGTGPHRLGPRAGQSGDGRERSGSNSSGSSHGGGKVKNTPVNIALKESQRFTATAMQDPSESILDSTGIKNRLKCSCGFWMWVQPAGLECKAAAGAMLEKGAEKSPTKARQPRKIDLRARYWAFLFDNLRRAVDEIYVTCESDQSVVECKEVLMMLDNYVRDFKALIDWIQLQEKLEKTDAQNRPTSLAWEVRKMSPGRHVMSSPTTDRIVPSPGVRRSLNFGLTWDLLSEASTRSDATCSEWGPPPTLAVARLSHSGPSWADRVKSSQALPAPGQTTGTAEKPGEPQTDTHHTRRRFPLAERLLSCVVRPRPQKVRDSSLSLMISQRSLKLLPTDVVCVLCLPPLLASGKTDAEGWETVQRGRSMRSRSVAMVAKVSPVLAHVSPKAGGETVNGQLPASSRGNAQGPGDKRRPDKLVSPEQKSECEKAPAVEPPSDRDQEPRQCVAATPDQVRPPVSEPLPAPPSPQTQTPAPVPEPPPSSSQPEEPGAQPAAGGPELLGAVWRVTAPSAAGAAEAAVARIPPAGLKLESMLDPTELSTVSAERHGPGSRLPPKQRQSQKPSATAGVFPNLPPRPFYRAFHRQNRQLTSHREPSRVTGAKAALKRRAAYIISRVRPAVNKLTDTGLPPSELPLHQRGSVLAVTWQRLRGFRSGEGWTPQSMAEVLAKKEELADRLEKANEEAIASAIAEEEQLTREIQAENSELERDSDFSASIGGAGCGLNLDWSEMLADYDAREPWRQSTSWGDIVEEEPARPPGHGIHMHEKLSSPSRRRTIAESKKKHEEKQLKAQQLRDKLKEEKTHKLQKLLEREKEVRKWKEELLDQRRRMMEEKLVHAEFKRELQLQAIVKKAQEEEAKVNEIAFINTLEAQNKRHDVLAKLNEYEQRLNELQEERQKRQEEKQARDEAVQERKRALEAERQARVEELLMKRREQEARIEQQRQEKERAREDAARERARDREERLAALSAAQQEAMEELQKKIQLKARRLPPLPHTGLISSRPLPHDESSRRHMEQIEQRKGKAAELSSGRHANTDYAPKLTPYERKKQCSLCSVVITSEVHLFSHTKGKRHQQAVRDSSSIQGRELSDEEVEHLSLKKYIVDVVTDSTLTPESPRDREEKQKARKKAKKLRARMNSRAKEYETSMESKMQILDSPYKAKLQRLVKDLGKQLQGQDSGQWASNKVSGLDRTLGEISRILEKQNNADQVAFQVGGGLSALEQILQVVMVASTPTAVPRIPLSCLPLNPGIPCRFLSGLKEVYLDPKVSSVPSGEQATHAVEHAPGAGRLCKGAVVGVAIPTLSRPPCLCRWSNRMASLLRSLCTAVNVYYLACSHCSTNCCYVFYSNRIAPLLDLVLHQLTPSNHSISQRSPRLRLIPSPFSPSCSLLVPPFLPFLDPPSFNLHVQLYVPDEDRSIFGRGVNKQVFEGLITGLLQTTAAVLSLLHPSGPEAGRTSPRGCSPDAKSKPAPSENFTTRAQDLLSYVVNMGLLDKLYACFLSVQGPIDESPKISAFLEQATSLLHATCKLCFSVMGRSASIFDNKRQDATGLTPLLQSLDLVGVLHMLYCILLHSGLPEPQGAGPALAPELYGPTVVRVALQALRFLNCYALLNLAAFQSVLGAEGLSLAFRHIVSSLLWYCSQNSSEELLHEIIICVGYFTVNHPDNQVIVQSGRQPSVLQKLCQLPFQYFSHPRLIRVLFPTLISACYNNPHNKVILKQEMSCVLLATFIQDCASSDSQTDSRPAQEKSSAPLDYCELPNRFPRDQWDCALHFFLSEQQEE
ncbi:hypothetical protein P4O66_015727 [Electrophorus voltai]|uniref:U1-type domain-containing protein n=1 Tax=Electrophorus voltai TaxID=2609070 RepID=A0AAD8Z210_9TELE|nr:hypothetical protein P4O66_015727 [Electrophorus voltai]